jgi:alpha-1,6-mannosyltransferase
VGGGAGCSRDRGGGRDRGRLDRARACRRGTPVAAVGTGPARVPALDGRAAGRTLRRAAGQPPALAADLVRILALLGVAWIVAWLCAARIPAAALWAGVVVAYGVLLLGPPLPLTDLFNYLHYGRMGPRYGLNPYVALPLDAPRDAAYPYSNWHHLPSP